MKPTHALKILPLAAALFAALLMTGCNRHDNDDTAAVPPATSVPPADTMPSETMPPASTTAMMPPATTTTGMPPASSTTGMPPGTSTVGMASGPDTGPTMGMATGSLSDTQFYSQALSGGHKEVALSELAAKKSTDADVKRIANEMIRDHKAMDKKIAGLAGSSAPTAPAASTLTADLQGKTGHEFDHAYIDALVNDHQQAISMFENASKNASTAEARRLASDALPDLRNHLKDVQKVQQKLGSM